MHLQKPAYRPQFAAFLSDDAITIGIGIDKWTHKSVERSPMNPKVFDQSPESAVRFELRYVRADGLKALLKIPRWPVCFHADYHVQKLQRRFRKSLMQRNFVEPMDDSVGIGHSLQPPVNLAKRCRGHCHVNRSGGKGLQ